MPIINLLPPLLADLIAAGEVVERPASVIKELWENSIDAGANKITADIRGGGLTYLRVSDNGCGMSPEDAAMAFLRHATSKLRTERDLEAIHTLGFRGEALAAISAVSRIELLTRLRGDALGTRISIEAGEIISLDGAGCPYGTIITIRDLFYNTPARQKFTKSDRAEGAACLLAAQKTALGFPDISFRFKKDDKDELYTPGDGKIISAIYSVLGRESAAAMLKIPETTDELPRVTGYVSSPAMGRGNRGAQYFFVGGRPIRSPVMQTALEQAYKNTLLTGKFPSCVLYLELKGGAVDVNVHPAKTEVRFADERAVFDSVFFAVKNALDAENKLALERPERENCFSPERPVQTASHRPEIQIAPPEKTAPPPQISLHTPVMTYAQSPTIFIPKAPEPEPSPTIFIPKAPEPPVQAGTPEPPSASPPDEPPVIIGEAMNTYILVQRGDELIFIDKHAAHERLIFDRYLLEGRAFMSQSLITPLIYSPGGAALESLENSVAALSALGFQLERFGERELLIRAVPAEIFPEDAPSMLDELAEQLRPGLGGGNIAELLHTVACRAAIKAGKASAPEELYALAQSVLSGEAKYCPHGRPVFIKFTKKDLDKQFKRIV